MSLKGKVAIVTGGNSGIGKAIVLGLARAGANIVIDYVVHPEATEALEQEVASLGDRSIGVDADVSRVEDLQKLVDDAIAKFGRLDIMVNNAGVETRTSVLDTTEAQYDKVLSVNTKSVTWFSDPANRAEAIKIMVEASKLKEEEVAKSYDFLHKNGFFETTGKVSKAKMSALLAALKGLGDIEGPTDLEHFVLPGVTQLSD